MQPAGAARPGGVGDQPDERGRNAAPLIVRVDGGIEQEGVASAIPGDVDVADKSLAVIGTGMDETARQDLAKVT